MRGSATSWAVSVIWVALSAACISAAAEPDGPHGLVDYEQKRALIIGIDYEGRTGGPPVLEAAQRDAEDLARVLRDYYGYREEDIRTVVGANASLARIQKLLGSEFLADSEALHDASVIFFFSGHSVRKKDHGFDGSESEESYAALLPYDVEFDDNRVAKPETVLDMDTLGDLLRRNCPARHKLVILDSCYSGYLLSRGTRAQERLDVPEIDAPALFSKPAFMGLTATLSDEEAADRTHGQRNSPFTAALLSSLEGRLEEFGYQPIRSQRLASWMEAPFRVNLENRGVSQTLKFAPLPSSTGEGDFYFIPIQPYGEISKAIFTLPGLNGLWWFEEVPWLVPSVRVASATVEEKRREAGYGGNPPDFEEFRLYPDADRMLRMIDENLLAAVNSGDLSEEDRELREALRDLATIDLAGTGFTNRLEAILQSVRVPLATEPRQDDPEVWHTRAIFQHRLATLRNDEEMAEMARASYRLALEGYEAGGGRYRPLHALCLADRARLSADPFREYTQAANGFAQAREKCGTSIPFQVNMFCGEGEAYRKLPGEEAVQRASQAYEQAVRLAETLKQSDSDPEHPLLAHAHERFAWFCMDHWMVQEAQEHFKAALEIREENNDETSAEFAEIFIYHNQHGLAIAQRYSGDLAEARREFREVVTRIEKRPPGGSQQYSRQLVIRHHNSLERLADCELYQGLAADQCDLFDEWDEQDRASGLYLKSFNLVDPEDRSTRTVLMCKWIIASALRGQLQQATLELQKLRDQEEVTGKSKARVELLKRVADTVITFKQSGGAEARAKVREVLGEFDPGNPDHVGRDNLELRLLLAEMLVTRECADEAWWEQAAEDAEYLVTLADAFPPNLKCTYKYRRRYYDSAIDAVQQTDFRRACRYSLAARGQSMPDDGVGLVVFHFAEDAEQGFVVVLPADSPGQCFPFDFGVQAIKGGTLPAPLPAELLEQVQRMKASDAEVRVFWADKEVHDLSSVDWPWGRQISLAELRQLPR